MVRSWGQQSLDYAQSEVNAQRPTAEVLIDGYHIRNGTRTVADVSFNHREGQ